MVRSLTIVAVVFVLSGMVLLFGPVVGFSTIAADRGVFVSVAETNEGFIELDNSDPDELPNNDFVEVASLNNNLDSEIETEYEISVDDDEVEVRFNHEDGDQNEGNPISGETLLSESAEIEMDCGSPGGRDSDVVALEVQIERATSTGITIQNANMELIFVCGQEGGAGGGDIEFEELTAEVTEEHNQAPDEVTFEWSLTEEAEFIDITVNTGNTDTVRIEEEIAAGTESIEINAHGQAGYPFEVIVDIDGGEMCTAEIDQEDGVVEIDKCI